MRESFRSMYDRSDREAARPVLDWDGGVSWIAHPKEDSKRASHAICTGEGVWLLDPLDAKNLWELVEPLGEIAGVAVLSAWHARDAGAVADRYDVPVHIPEWMDRVEQRVEAPVQRFALTPDDAFRTIPCRPFPGWQELFVYHEASETLVVPDSLATVDVALVGDERLAPSSVRRLQPPLQLSGLEPDRILVGHGEPITEDAPAALESALDQSYRTILRATVENGRENLEMLVGALR